MLSSLKALISRLTAGGDRGRILELAGFVDRNFHRACELLDEVALHEVAFALELFQTFLRGRTRGVGQVLLTSSCIFFSIFSRSSGVNAVGDKSRRRIRSQSRTMAKLGLGKEFEHSCGQQVRGGMPVDFERSGSRSVRMRRSVSLSSGRVRSIRLPWFGG